ncbi:hypothetical protein SLS62_009908 [Diatrype stigma]|uniref:Uncharacterized protein n=1 Tax=Diatrype stigma TaxID=117547 RepID=A0AAN9UF11_9PEZI
MLLVNSSSELRSKTRFLGIDVKKTFVIAKDGYTGVRAVPYYTQEELANMVASAQKAHDASHSTKLCPSARKRRSYAQDLAERLFALPGALANKLGALLDTRHSATNKSQYTRREWKVVFMKPIENPIAGEVTRNNVPSLSYHTHQSHTKKGSTMQKWLLIVRGQVTQTSEDGFVAFDTASNPWLRVDERLHREKRYSRVKSAND